MTARDLACQVPSVMGMRVVVLLAALGGAAATFLPWQIIGGTVRDGWSSTGTISFVAFAIALACAAYKPMWYVRVALFVLAMIALAGAVKTIGEIGYIQKTLSRSLDAASRREAALYKIGTGAWLAVAAALGLVFGAFLWKRPKPGMAAALPKARLVR